MLVARLTTPEVLCPGMMAWCTYLNKDIELLEKVQHRATKMMTDMRDKTYEDRLRTLHFTTLETRCIRV